MKLGTWMTSAAMAMAMVGCGKGGAAKPAAIETYAPVSNFRPSGGVASVELAWKAAPGVDRYHVTVSAPEGTELWKTDAPHSPVMFSTEGVMATRATWQVQGFAGTTLRAQSKPGDLDLARQPGSPPP